VKTLVDEQEVQSSSPAIPQKARVPQAGIQSQTKAEAKTPVVTQPQADCYESCLDIAALFLARG
jgi:hypothetical protein